MFGEVQRLGAKLVDLFFVVEGLQRGIVDALEDGLQGFLFAAFFLLDVDNLSDALFKGGFAMGVRFEFHEGKNSKNMEKERVCVSFFRKNLYFCICTYQLKSF